MAQYPNEIKNRAYQLYIEYGNLTDVYEVLVEEFQDTYDKLPTKTTISNWVRRNNLPEVVKNIETDAIIDSRTREIERVILRREEQKDMYKKMADKAHDALFGEKPKHFRDAYDAVRAADMAIRGERKLENEQLNVRFVEDVFNAVVSVVSDESVLRDIGIQLRKVLSSYNSET